MAPLYLCAHSSDNVGIVVDTEGAFEGESGGYGLVVRERIPQAQKIALVDLAAGDPVLRYGHVIGHTSQSIERGSRVREEMISMPSPPDLNLLPIANNVPAALPPLQQYSFNGFINTDGSVGTRNMLGITTTVQCVAPTVDVAVRRIKAELLPRYPNVDDVVSITHGYGCGVAIDAPGAQIPIRTLQHISLHANIAAQPLVVSLGCEKLQPERLFRSDLPVRSSGPRKRSWRC